MLHIPHHKHLYIQRQIRCYRYRRSTWSSTCRHFTQISHHTLHKKSAIARTTLLSLLLLRAQDIFSQQRIGVALFAQHLEHRCLVLLQLGDCCLEVRVFLFCGIAVVAVLGVLTEVNLCDTWKNSITPKSDQMRGKVRKNPEKTGTKWHFTRHLPPQCTCAHRPS